MLNLGSHLRFPPVGFLVRIRQWPAAGGTLVGEIFRVRRNLLEPGIGAVAVQPGLIAIQQIRQLLAVMHVCRGDAGAVCQAGAAVRADMHLHAEVPLVDNS